MPAVGLALLLAALLPRVEDPWPDTVGLELPVALAGAGSIVAGVLRANTSTTRPNGAIRRGGLWGFGIGALFYAISLLNQVISSL